MENKKILTILGAVIIVVLSGGAYLLLDSKNNVQNATDSSSQNGGGAQNPGSSYEFEVTGGTNKEVTEIVKKVAKHIYLPDGRVTVATVTNDIEGLKKENPVFFELAKPGDKVLIYEDRHILYDPVVDIILEVQRKQK